MKIRFADKKEMEMVSVSRMPKMLRGQQRETLRLMFSADATDFETLHALFKNEEKIGSFRITEEAVGTRPETHVEYLDYIVPGEPMIAWSEEGMDQLGNVQSNVYVVEMGQLSYLEKQLAKLGIHPLGR